MMFLTPVAVIHCQVVEELNTAKEQLASLQGDNGSKEGDGESVLAELDRARQEIAGLRYAITSSAA